MSYTKELLQLHLVQAEQALYRANNNSYSDVSKQEYQENLGILFDKIKQEIAKDFTTLNESQIYDGYKQHLDFIFKSLEFLESSTLNQIPYEIVECLNLAMNDWIEPTDKYIIVTNLVNNIHSFSYDSNNAFNEALHKELAARYNGIAFPHRLVQINLPKAFSRDYIVAVVLYHELGHFIDFRFSLMSSLVSELFVKIITTSILPDEVLSLKAYFPFLDNFLNNPTTLITHLNPLSNVYQVTLSHFREYFCDLFASQYVGEANNFYLRYISRNESNWVTTHPSTINRSKIVSDYITSTPNFIITLINQVLTSVKHTTLLKRYADLPSENFFNLIPTLVESEAEVHGLFNIAWKIWLQKQGEFEKEINPHHSTPLIHYKIINNLVEKSIGNYITLKKWNQSKIKLYPTTTAI